MEYALQEEDRMAPGHAAYPLGLAQRGHGESIHVRNGLGDGFDPVAIGIGLDDRHDLALVAGLANDLQVMADGGHVEDRPGPAPEIDDRGRLHDFRLIVRCSDSGFGEWSENGAEIAQRRP